MAERSGELDEYALRGIRAEIQRLQALERELSNRAAGRKGGIARRSTRFEAAVPGRKKRKLSAAGRKAISAAAKARWARQKAQNGSAGETSGGKKGGKKQ